MKAATPEASTIYEGDDRERRRTERLDTVELIGDQPRTEGAQHQADEHTERDQNGGASNGTAHDVRSARPKRHAHAEFVRALRDAVGNDRVDACDRKQERTKTKRSKGDRSTATIRTAAL